MVFILKWRLLSSYRGSLIEVSRPHDHVDDGGEAPSGGFEECAVLVVTSGSAARPPLHRGGSSRQQSLAALG